MNPFGLSFGLIRASDLIVDNDGKVVEGDWPVNQAAFAIQPGARPGPTSTPQPHPRPRSGVLHPLGRTLAPLTQDAAFYDDHAVFDDYTGVVLDTEEGKRRARPGRRQGRHPAQPAC